jgi:hypothetical protein
MAKGNYQRDAIRITAIISLAGSGTVAVGAGPCPRSPASALDRGVGEHSDGSPVGVDDADPKSRAAFDDVLQDLDVHGQARVRGWLLPACRVLPPGSPRLRHRPCLVCALSLSGMPEGCRKLVAWQVEKGRTLVIRKIVGRFDDDLDRRLSCVHSDGDFSIPEIDLVAPAPKDSVCHVRPLSGRNSREELCYSIPSPSSKKHPRIELQAA